MKKRISRFTLVEMLTVIAIIVILAGIITPVVIIARNQGKISSAESDVTSIMAALKSMAADYNGNVLKKDGTKYKTGSQEASVSDDIAKLTTFVAVNQAEDVNPNAEHTVYDAMITELSAPKNSGITVSVNRRKKIYLEPKKDFDPSKAYTAQRAALYRDPWGNPYQIMVKVTKNDEFKINNNKTIVGNFAVYSCGPNAKDDGGCNSDNPICGSASCDHDDIASWAI